MRFWIWHPSGKQFRSGSPRVGYDCGAQVLFENQDLARDFAEFAKVMDVLLNRRRAAARQSAGGLSNDVLFPSRPGCDGAIQRPPSCT
jgi:hypothetical protein